MILLGYAGMMMLGVLPLAAIARVTGVDAEHALLFPMPYALLVGLVIGLVVCLVVGRLLGLLMVDPLRTYEARRVVPSQVAPPRRRNAMRPGRMSGTAAAPLARF